jgi:hypothetical protein
MTSPRPNRPPRRCHGRVCSFNLGDERRFDRHIAVAGQVEKALRQIGVVEHERSLDLARRHLAIENPRQLMIGQQDRIVLGIEQLLRFDAVWHHAIGGDRAGAGQRDREDEAQRGHASVFVSGSIIIGAVMAGARPLT